MNDKSNTHDDAANSHVSRVNKWLDENVEAHPTPKKVMLSEFEVNWEELSGSFRVDFDDVQLKDRFDFDIEASGWTKFYIPMFVSPQGAPASYAAILIGNATENAITEGLHTSFPRLQPYGLNLKTGQETTQMTPIYKRIIDPAQFEAAKIKVSEKDYSISIFTK